MAKASGIVMPEGKRLLLNAAARLAARRGSAHGLVLREVAREAGLNHNTFYRHFDDMDAMLQAIAEDFATQLRQGIRAARANAAPGAPPSLDVVGWLFDHAQQYADVFTVALRELHGPPGPLRDVVRQTLADIAQDMHEDLCRFPGLSAIDPVLLRQAVDLLVRHSVWLCLDFLEQPERREALLDNAREAFTTLTLGVLARSKP
ncbi:TetR/AcrR family transcriptional regulator [Alcanivorax sp. JB21]|uniref:TetR/AcrR family transcriptional regulator n=1 Tax=Alcanivorax limicola TaxID=2874102 RepID=UPI001CBC3356|nr:TetR/AcrR family transcriptional regulator [Alcanivorax limicola]MBZ2188862.1 TetR/AcrR family transcriptional regulator [Alcanivorax limicola]